LFTASKCSAISASIIFRNLPNVKKHVNSLNQGFPTGEEFPPREEFHEFRGGISTLQLSYLFSVQ